MEQIIQGGVKVDKLEGGGEVGALTHMFRWSAAACSSVELASPKDQLTFCCTRRG